MRSELTVPQVFEPGARVNGRTGRIYVLWGVLSGCWYGWSADGESAALCSESDASDLLRVVAPAPREGQRWVHFADHTRRWDVLADGALWSGMSKLHIDDRSPVGLARWLCQFGYSFAGHADVAPEPTPAAATPAPWTLTAARRLITETIASAKPRRPAAFTAALCALAEHGVPPAKLVTETAATITALEAALPVHGAVARWQAERALWEMRDRLKGKLNGTQTIIALAAATLYLQRRGAW